MSKRRVVAEGAVTRIEVCPCGGCQLTIGPVTVTLHEGVIEELGETLAMAIRALRAQRTHRLQHAGGAPANDCAEPTPGVPACDDPSDTN